MHPAAQKVVERINGVEWRYDAFDFQSQMGVCGVTSEGRRHAVRFSIRDPNVKMSSRVFPRDYLVAYAGKVALAKQMIMDKLFSGEKCVEGDEMMEGNEDYI